MEHIAKLENLLFPKRASSVSTASTTQSIFSSKIPVSKTEAKDLKVEKRLNLRREEKRSGSGKSFYSQGNCSRFPLDIGI